MGYLGVALLKASTKLSEEGEKRFAINSINHLFHLEIIDLHNVCMINIFCRVY
jgi:hypothetical protein